MPTIIRNNDGPAILTNNGSVITTVTDTTITGNTASGDGGAMRTGNGTFTRTNCIFSGNYAAGNGGGFYATDPGAESITSMNCTFAGNSGERGGSIYSNIGFTSYLKVHNSILWGNESRASDDNQIDGAVIDDPGSIFRAEVQYTDIGLDQLYSVFSNQAGNIYVDPQFVDPIPASSAPTQLGDYHLLATSPVIDQALVASPPADDIDGQARPNPAGADIDMGADEYYSSVDLDETAAGTATVVATNETTINISSEIGNEVKLRKHDADRYCARN